MHAIMGLHNRTYRSTASTMNLDKNNTLGLELSPFLVIFATQSVSKCTPNRNTPNLFHSLASGLECSLDPSAAPTLQHRDNSTEIELTLPDRDPSLRKPNHPTFIPHRETLNIYPLFETHIPRRMITPDFRMGIEYQL